MSGPSVSQHLQNLAATTSLTAAGLLDSPAGVVQGGMAYDKSGRVLRISSGMMEDWRAGKPFGTALIEREIVTLRGPAGEPRLAYIAGGAARDAVGVLMRDDASATGWRHSVRPLPDGDSLLLGGFYQPRVAVAAGKLFAYGQRGLYAAPIADGPAICSPRSPSTNMTRCESGRKPFVGAN